MRWMSLDQQRWIIYSDKSHSILHSGKNNHFLMKKNWVLTGGVARCVDYLPLITKLGHGWYLQVTSEPTRRQQLWRGEGKFLSLIDSFLTAQPGFTVQMCVSSDHGLTRTRHGHKQPRTSAAEIQDSEKKLLIGMLVASLQWIAQWTRNHTDYGLMWWSSEPMYIDLMDTFSSAVTEI